jgi:hypothetical protein
VREDYADSMKFTASSLSPPTQRIGSLEKEARNGIPSSRPQAIGSLEKELSAVRQTED